MFTAVKSMQSEYKMWRNMLCEPIEWNDTVVCAHTRRITRTSTMFSKKELTTDALDLSSSELKPTQPYPDSLAVKSLSIWTFEVENSSYIACKK